MIPKKFTADGDNVNPPLSWVNPPEGTKSFALIVDDPDTSHGTIHHWLLKDISNSTTNIPEGSSAGTGIPNFAGKLAYTGPAPPSGVHRYFFKLYALNVGKLAAKNKDALYKEVEEKKIKKAVYMGRYTR